MAHSQTPYVTYHGCIRAPNDYNLVRYEGGDATMSSADADETKEYPCLVRVTDGHDANFSTHVRLVTICAHDLY